MANQQHQFDQNDNNDFQLLNITPDPNKSYSVEDFETARDEQYRLLESRYANDNAIREQKRAEIRKACERLSDKFSTNKKQKSASENGGSSAWKRYETDRKAHYAIGGKGENLSLTNVGSSYVMFMLIQVFIDAGSKVFPKYDGPPFSLPEFDNNEISATPEDESNVRKIFEEAGPGMGLQFEFNDDGEHPDKIAGVHGPDYSDCTPEQQQARQEFCRKHHERAQELGLMEAPRSSSPAPGASSN